MAPLRLLFFCLGILALLIGLIGVVVPLLPTTPFLLLATLCFARSSERFHSSIINHPRYGPAVRDWQLHGVIRLRAKVLATVLLALGLTVPWLLVDMPLWLRVTSLIVVLVVALFIWSRPSHKVSDTDPTAKEPAHDHVQ